jgi:hypothetical protein
VLKIQAADVVKKRDSEGGIYFAILISTKHKPKPARVDTPVERDADFCWESGGEGATTTGTPAAVLRT